MPNTSSDLVARLAHYTRRARYLVARAKKAIAGFVASGVAVVTAVELVVDEGNAGTETSLTAGIVGLATALGVWVAPKNEPAPNDQDHAKTPTPGELAAHDELTALEGVDVDAVAPYVEPTELPPWDRPDGG
jgi:hypothetical protein